MMRFASIPQVSLASLLLVSAPGLGAEPVSAGEERPQSPGPLLRRNWYGVRLDDMEAAVRRGEGRDALAYYERRAGELVARGLGVDAAANLNAAVFMARRLGEYQRAIRAGLRSLDVVEAQARDDAVLNAVLNARIRLGGVYRDVGDAAAARRHYEDGLAGARALADPVWQPFWIANFRQALGTIAQAEGDTEAALRHGEDSARLLRRFLEHLPRGAKSLRARHDGKHNLTGSLWLIADAHRRHGNLDEAGQTYREILTIAQELRSRRMEANALASLGQLALRRGEHAGALARLEQARALAARFDFTPTLINVHGGIAASHDRLGRPDDALVSIRQAIAHVEDVRSRLQESGLRSAFLDDRQSVYHQAARLAVDAGRADEAFGFSERSRARAFLDLLGTQTTLSKGRTQALVAEEMRLRARLGASRVAASQPADEAELARARRQAEAMEAEYRAFLERVRKESPEQASLMTVEPVTLAEVQGLLPEGTTLLEYLVTEHETLLWVVDRATMTVTRLPVGRAKVAGAVESLRAAIARLAAIDVVEARARALYAELVAPVRSRIRGTQVMIVPHDVLHYLPFGALRTPDGRWLLEDYTLATLPSASVLKYLGGKEARGIGRVLAVGNPALPDASALPYAEREARIVAQRYPDATLLVRRDATEARVRGLLRDAGLVHFATHGELSEHDPLASALRLTPESPDDGRLEVRELFGLELDARLVVLSACETGLGQLSRGDELVGLQRAFIYAGAPAVITTLWKVDDRSTYELMRAFYAHLAARGVAGALREAQRETMKAFPHPFAWAAFGLAGLPR